MTATRLYTAHCLKWLRKQQGQQFHLTFLDPPFNQGKDYREHDDSMDDTEYWSFMHDVCSEVERLTVDGGCVYLMHREKNLQSLMSILHDTGWTIKNTIIWKKTTSPPPSKVYSLAYQPILFAVKGPEPLVFHKLRINPLLPPGYAARPNNNGVNVSDVWVDIREMTSGFLAGKEALLNANGERAHKQQAPIALLLRILLSSSDVGMTVLDPFAGSGTTAVVARQLRRNSVSVELDPVNVKLIKRRLNEKREADSIKELAYGYHFTEGLVDIWPGVDKLIRRSKHAIF